MNCDGIFDALATEKRDLGPDEKAAVEAHLATCESCRALEAGLDAFHAALGDPSVQDLDPPDVQAAIMEVAEEEAARNRERARPRTARRVFVGTALAASLYGAFFLGTVSAPMLADPVELQLQLAVSQIEHHDMLSAKLNLEDIALSTSATPAQKRRAQELRQKLGR